MRKFLLTVIFLCCCVPALRAQEAAAPEKGARIDEIIIETRTSFHQQLENGVYDSHFQGEYLNLRLAGQLAPNLTFFIRQRFNRKIDDDNPFSATDHLWLRWQASPKWSLTAGKQAILVGGYEIDSAPIDVYYYGAFSNHLYQYYAFGAALSYSPAAGQSITFQFCPSPISPVTQNAYSYNLYWNGHIQPWWKTTWSYNLVEDELHRKMNWVVLGNKFELGPLAVDIDYIDRIAFGQQNPFSDWSAILKAILTVGKWNLCTKVGYERNDASNTDPNWNPQWNRRIAPDHIGSLDLVLPAGNDYFYYGAGVEFFPLGGERLRLHAVYFGDNHDRIHNFDIGLTWRFSVFKR